MDIFDNLRLVSYVAAANVYDESKNLFHGFLPLIESVLQLKADRHSISFLALQQKINETYHVNIPKNTLRYLLKVLSSQGKVTFDDGKNVGIIKEKLLEQISQDENGKNAIEDFFLTFNKELEDNNKAASLSDIRENVVKWIYYHSWDLAQFIDIGTFPDDLSQNDDQIEWEYYPDLMSFLLKSKKEGSQSFSSFVKLFDGAVQTSLLNYSPEQIKPITDKTFAFDHILLDTNFILRLLGLQPPLDNEAAKSTWESLFNCGAEFYVLSQTVQEASNSIKKFLQDIEPYTQNTQLILGKSKINTSGFLSAYQNGTSRTQFLECSNTETIRNILMQDYKVQLIDDCDDPVIEDEEINDLIASKKLFGYGKSQAKHDLTLISYCRKKRSNRIRSFSDIKWWILTNDRKLTYWNQKNCNEYQECITEIQLSNLLWLLERKDNSGGLVNTIVAFASKYAINLSEVSAFSKQIELYRKRNYDNRIDNLALVFASSVITEDDLRLASEDEESFDKVIGIRVEQITKIQNEQIKQLEDSRDEQYRLSQTIEQMNKQFEKDKLIMQKKNTAAEIKALDEKIVEDESTLEQINNVRSYCQSIEKSTGRITILSIIAPLSIVFLGFGIWGIPCLIRYFKEHTLAMNAIFAVTSGGILVLLFTILFKVVVILVFGKPLSPRELFYVFRDKILLNRKEKYVINHHYKWELVENDLEILLNAQKQSLDEKRNNKDNMLSIIQGIDEKLAAS